MTISSLIETLIYLITGAILANLIDKYLEYKSKRQTKIIIKKDKTKKLESKNSNLDNDDYKNKFIILIGLGGVGSNALLPLIQLGIKYIRIIDYDKITLSSLNRHSCATREDVDKTKVDFFVEFSKQLNQNVTIEGINAAFTIDKAEALLSGNPDYVIDCIDDLETKVDLIHYCVVNKIKIISSLGAAGKKDPCQIRFGKFNEIKGETMAKRMRYQYKKAYPKDGLPDITCVYSLEKNVRGLTELDPNIDTQNKTNWKNEAGIYERLRTLPVFACLPSAFGSVIANKVIGDLIGYKFTTDEPEDSKADLDNVMIGNVSLTKLIEDYKTYELNKRNFDPKKILLVYNDYLSIAKAFDYSSAVSNKKGGKLKFIRWRPFKPPGKDNLVLLNKNEINTLYSVKTESELIESFGLDCVNRVDNILKNLV